MKAGYLSVETHRDHPNRVRITWLDRRPSAPIDEKALVQIRYTAQFDDAEAAVLHVHDRLRRRLIDGDAHFYRASVARAIAAIDAVGLEHRPIYLDRKLDHQQRQQIDHFTHAYLQQQAKTRHFFDNLGYLGIGLLLFNLFILARLG